MGLSLLQLRNKILTSLYGRRLGLTPNAFLVGPKSLQLVTQDIGAPASTASTTSTEILNYGITSLAVGTGAATTGSSYGTVEVGGVYALAAPEPGVEKIIYTASNHSTMLITVAFSTGVTGGTSNGSTFGGVSFNAPNQWVRLIGASTSKWLVAGIATGASVAAT